MEHETGAEGTLPGEGGVELFYRWRPADEPRETLVFVHGLAEHTGRLDHVFDSLEARGCSCLGFDLRGHGRSGGRRHHVPRFEAYLDDLDRVLERADSLADGPPRFLVAHSAGGLIALVHALERRPRLAGIVLLSPALAFARRPSRFELVAARLLNVVFPTFLMPSRIPLDRVSRDPEVERILRAENPGGIHVSPRWYFECRRAQELVASRIGELAVPLLTLAAGTDALVDPETSRRLHAAAGGGTPEDFVLLPDCFHGLFDEPERDEILARVVEWIRRAR